MKSSFLLSATAILPLMGLLTLSACQGVIFPEEEYTETSVHKLTVLTRSTYLSSTVPVQVFAFDAEGRLLDACCTDSPDDGVTLSLPMGPCRIVAASGMEVGETPTLQTILQMPEANYSTEPLALGLADVTMSNKPQTLNLLMAHQVAQLQMTLSDVPTQVTDVQVSVSSPFSQISLQGESQQPHTARIPCVHADSVWTTGTVYVLPTPQSDAAFSIHLSFGDREETFSYTYPGVLAANTPYIMNGSYSGSVALNGWFIRQEWENAVQTFFQFGPGVSQEPSGEPEPDEEVTVDEIPEAGSLWDGHVVAGVIPTTDGAQLLLLSLKEWDGLTSALSEENPQQAQQLAGQYEEKQLQGWRIPTKEEAQALMQGWTDRLDVFNELILSEEGQPMSGIDEHLATVRYLCEDATYSFALVSGCKLAKAGAKLDTYHLRLVKTISVIQQ